MADIKIPDENSGDESSDNDDPLDNLSDEDDDGVGLARKNENGMNYWEENMTRYNFTAEDIKQSLENSLPHTRFSLSAIIATEDETGRPCRVNNGRAVEVGYEYIEAARLTGGHVESLCNSDWSALLDRLAASISNQRLDFPLSKLPILESITVTIDGVEITNWQYDQQSNKIKIAETQAPEGGAEITISYKTSA